MIRLFMIAITLMAFCGGCAGLSRQSELEQVAKDWSMTIRASQIIPVYPLTEDLQPGDVFLVQVPIDQQQTVYAEKGFLPLDNMICRVYPQGYKDFYRNSFLTDSNLILPKDWLTTNPAWSGAPTAKFPTYSFSVKRGGGFNLALPVQGVPIGLSLLGGDAAYGSIVIADAKTYGIDVISLEKDVRDWAQKKEKKEFLANFSPGDGKQNYLRVVDRVYLTGKLNVSIQSGRSGSAGVSAGANKPVDVLAPGVGADAEKNTMETYTKNLDKLNGMLEEALKKIKIGDIDQFVPGATVKVVVASSNSISLDETFFRPVVIGYLGFDMQIGPGGELGPPIPTHAILSKEIKYPTSKYLKDASSEILRNFWKPDGKTDEGHQAELKAWMKENMLENVSITFFISSEKFKEERAKAVTELKLPR